MDNLSYKKLEIDIILSNLKEYIQIDSNKDYLDTIIPSNDVSYLNIELEKTDEAVKLLSSFQGIDLSFNGNLDEEIVRVSKNGVLTPIELFDFVLLDEAIKECNRLKSQANKNNVLIKELELEFNQFVDLSHVILPIKKKINYDGTLYDNASSELSIIRSKLKVMDGKIHNKLNEIKQKEGNKLSDTVVVIRDNHYCLSVKSEYKNSFKGILRDTSSSLSTLYMEPLSVLEIVNEKEKLIEEEQREINKILYELSSSLCGESYNLENNYNIIKDIDIVFAKAKYAKKLDAVKPIIVEGNNASKLNLISARHPLIDPIKCIPNNISFNNYLGIIITGPNTGGKTVLLKTVGLMCLMVKLGMLIPVNEGSMVPIFSDIYADIGDDQSILNNLSTFSSHMNNIISIINDADKNSLVLFDEIGSGTDPLEGSSIAIAVLKYLINNNISFITTTHYSDLKIFAFEESRIINACMEFNEDTLSPTYKLLLGVSGSSNAFNIAKRLGLSDDIISSAKDILSKQNNDVKITLDKMEEKNQILSLKEKEINNKLLEINELKNKLNLEYLSIDKKEQQLLKKAEIEADKIINDAKDKSQALIERAEDIVKSNPKIHEIADIKHQMRMIESLKKELNPDMDHEYSVGEAVYIPKFDQYGKVMKVGKLINVSFGSLNMNFKKEDLILSNNIPKLDFEDKKYKQSGKVTVQMSTKNVGLKLDLRGKRYEEAKDLIDEYLDDLVFKNLKFGMIVHGFGTGTIRNLVQEMVKKNKNVASYRYGQDGEGGNGCTVVEMK